MCLSHISLAFLTFVALCAILIVLNCDIVTCGPLRRAPEDNDTKGTVKINLKTDVDRPAFHGNRKNGVFYLPNINPEIINGLIDSDGDMVTEGDIFVQYDRNAVENRWPSVKGKVSLPYVISSELASKADDILEAMNMISNKTCVRFHKLKNEQDYLDFQPAYGCASFIGFLGGAQPVYVGLRCTPGNIVHELLHALGFYHEHSRKDRDNHIEIIYENIIEGKERNFRKAEGDTQDLPYDLGSILHYGSLFFSSNGSPTVVSKKKNLELGQRTHLSELDVQRIQKLYHCVSQKGEGGDSDGHGDKKIH
ncbi:hypothetical protein ACEWY4_004123 [Coilia grayii]|uniref:Metalloendopeptidase n=1 Tax=Coilia grayii TaxID=363190 RepID=A0ABD1KKL4_9TELE